MEIGGCFRAPVVGQLQDAALPGNPGTARFFLFRDDLVAAQHGEEIEAEFAAFIIAFAQERHAEDAGVEIERCRRVFDAQHGVVVGEATGGRVVVLRRAGRGGCGEAHVVSGCE